MKSRVLLLLLALVLFPTASQAATLTGADLPGAGRTLTITENTQFLIGSGETAAWDGVISVGGGFTVDFLNNGSILGNALLQTSNSASFNFRNKGILGGNVNISNDTGTFNFSNDGTTGGNFNLTNTGGGIFNFQNNEDIPQLNFNINTRGATTNLLNTGGLSGNFNFNNDSSASVNFLNNGTLGAAALVTVSNSAGQFNFQSNGNVLGAFNVTNTGSGSFNFQNNGELDAKLNFNTYAAETNLSNTGRLSGTLNLLDQNDDTKIFNSGTILAALNLTANGALGSIGLQNNGAITDVIANLNANYGGQIFLNNIFGSADFEKLNINANGSSHDVYSSFLMYYNQNVTVDELYAYGLQDTSFLEEWLDRTFEGSGGGKMTFRYVGGSPQTVPEPATMLLLCTGLIGLWGTKRFRLIG